MPPTTKKPRRLTPTTDRQKIRTALEQTQQIKLASEKLGIGPSTLHRWIKKDPSLADGIQRCGIGRLSIEKSRPECECSWLKNEKKKHSKLGHHPDCPRKPEDNGQRWDMVAGRYIEFPRDKTCPTCDGKGTVAVKK